MLEDLIDSIQPANARILEQALSGSDLGEEEVVHLFSAEGQDLWALVMAADRLRRERVGDVVTYVVNRNINFTNVCVKRCGFCAFSRTRRSTEGYFLPIEEVVRRAQEAHSYGATEVCIQAGLPPEMEGDLYIRLCRAVKESVPELHIHAFSPEEVLYGSTCSGRSIRDYLRALQDAGIGSLPGTSAEILDDEVRARISPGRISTSEWVEVITTAHELGIPTTSTIMYGHLETARHCARHLLLLRDLQRRSGGFTEFVPLSFVHTEAPLFQDGLIAGVRPGAAAAEVLKMHAVARLVLNQDIPNIQVSWVKEGTQLSQICLAAGANDFGGTLINESISTAAGAPHGQLMRPREIQRCIREAGRKPAERSTCYEILECLAESTEETAHPLDRIGEADAEQFGSYRELTRREQFSFLRRSRQEPLG